MQAGFGGCGYDLRLQVFVPSSNGGDACGQVLAVDLRASGQGVGEGSGICGGGDLLGHVPAAAVPSEARRIWFDACHNKAPLQDEQRLLLFLGQGVNLMNGFIDLAAIIGFFAVFGMLLLFFALRLYIIQRLRTGGALWGEGSGDFMPGGFHGLGCGNVGTEGGKKKSGGKLEHGGGRNDRIFGHAGALSGQVERGAADSNTAGGGGVGAAGGAQCVEGGANCGQAIHRADSSQQVVDINARAAAAVVSRPVCYARSITSRRGGHRVSLQAVRAVVAACNTARDVEAKSWLSSVTGAAVAIVRGGGRVKGALDAPELIAAGGARATKGGGVPVTVVRGADVLGLALTGRNRLLVRGEGGGEVLRWGFEVGALDAPDVLPQGGVRAVDVGGGSRAFALSRMR